jgi:hypothetical protein
MEAQSTGAALQAPPVDGYTNVTVYSIQGGGRILSNGTGTYSEIGVFSCGPFSDDKPIIGQFYNITGNSQGGTHSFPGYKCVHSGPTSDFKQP